MTASLTSNIDAIFGDPDPGAAMMDLDRRALIVAEMKAALDVDAAGRFC